MIQNTDLKKTLPNFRNFPHIKVVCLDLDGSLHKAKVFIKQLIIFAKKLSVANII